MIKKNESDKYNIFSSSKNYPKKEEKNNIDTDTDIFLFNEYSQKLSFKKTNNCKEGCYLLITYQSIYFENENEPKIIGTEFSLLGRILEDVEEFKSQIINIPLNEYIQGSFESSSFNIHYYSIYIPDKTKNIILELNVNNIAIFAKKDVKKINIYNIDSLTKKYFGNLLLDINLQDLGINSIEDEYITFALLIYLPLENSHYYFRVLQENSDNDYIIYPLDTNKANICNTSEIQGDYYCMFFLDNIYKDLNNDIILYAYGESNVNSVELFAEHDKNDYYYMELEKLDYKLINKKNNTFYKIENKDYLNTKFILIKIQSSYNETLTILTNFYANSFIFPPVQIYSYQLVYLNESNSFNINIDNNSTRKYRIVIHNTYGVGEIKKDTNSSNVTNYNSIISGNRIISFVITKEMKNITILNKNYINIPLVFSVKSVYELNNQVLEELYFNNDYTDMTKKFPIKYFLKEIEYKSADINFYFQNYDFKKEDILISGYIIKYDLMKLITDKTFLQLDFGEEIKGNFDNRTNIGLIGFDIGNDSLHYDYYYLIEIVSKNKDLTETTLDIFASSKNASQFSMPNNKYISGSFDLDLTKDQIQMQRYYIYDFQNSSIDKYIVEFSSNYKYIDIIFSNNIEEIKENITNGGIQKFIIKINKDNKENNYFDVIINNALPNMENNYCKSANYIIRYYQSNQVFNYTVCLHGIITNGKNHQKLTIKNDNYQEIDGNYNITCIFNLYEKKRKLEDEILNTIALTDSENIYLATKYYEQPIEEECFYFNNNNRINADEYIGTVFVILKNNSDEGKISYYSFEFNIVDKDKEEQEQKEQDKKDKDEKEKEENKRTNKLVAILISVFFVITIIVLILGFIKYRQIKDKNKDLEQKVNEISFSSDDIYKDEEESRVTFV